MAFQWNDDPRDRVMAENWNEIRNRIRTLENSINIPNYPTPTVSIGQQITPNAIQEYKKALDEVKAKNYCREHNGSHYTSNRNSPHYNNNNTGHYYFDDTSPHYSATHRGVNYDGHFSTHDGSSDKSTAHQSANRTHLTGLPTTKPTIEAVIAGDVPVVTTDLIDRHTIG
jgi:hypothetical protein